MLCAVKLQLKLVRQKNNKVPLFNIALGVDIQLVIPVPLKSFADPSFKCQHRFPLHDLA